MGQHRLPIDPHPDGEVFVDTDSHELVDTTVNPARIIGRTRTTPNRHDGTRDKR